MNVRNMAKAIAKKVKSVVKKTSTKKEKVVQIEKVTCSDCGGRGLRDAYTLCTTCNGTGKI